MPKTDLKSFTCKHFEMHKKWQREYNVLFEVKYLL